MTKDDKLIEDEIMILVTHIELINTTMPKYHKSKVFRPYSESILRHTNYYILSFSAPVLEPLRPPELVILQ